MHNERHRAARERRTARSRVLFERPFSVWCIALYLIIPGITSDAVGDWQTAGVRTSPETSQVETATDQST